MPSKKKRSIDQDPGLPVRVTTNSDSEGRLETAEREFSSTDIYSSLSFVSTL
jgi:hypothetical protein